MLPKSGYGAKGSAPFNLFRKGAEFFSENRSRKTLPTVEKNAARSEELMKEQVAPGIFIDVPGITKSGHVLETDAERLYDFDVFDVWKVDGDRLVLASDDTDDTMVSNGVREWNAVIASQFGSEFYPMLYDLVIMRGPVTREETVEYFQNIGETKWANYLLSEVTDDQWADILGSLTDVAPDDYMNVASRKTAGTTQWEEEKSYRLGYEYGSQPGAEQMTTQQISEYLSWDVMGAQPSAESMFNAVGNVSAFQHGMMDALSGNSQRIDQMTGQTDMFREGKVAQRVDEDARLGDAGNRILSAFRDGTDMQVTERNPYGHEGFPSFVPRKSLYDLLILWSPEQIDADIEKGVELGYWDVTRSGLKYKGGSKSAVLREGGYQGTGQWITMDEPDMNEPKPKVEGPKMDAPKNTPPQQPTPPQKKDETGDKEPAKEKDKEKDKEPDKKEDKSKGDNPFAKDKGEDKKPDKEPDKKAAFKIADEWSNEDMDEDSLRENEMSETDDEQKDEPTQGDIVMTPSGPLGSRTSVGEVEGKFLGEFDTDEEAETFIRQYMQQSNWYPDVWFQDDHGGMTLRTLSASKTAESDEEKNLWMAGRVQNLLASGEAQSRAHAEQIAAQQWEEQGQWAEEFERQQGGPFGYRDTGMGYNAPVQIDPSAESHIGSRKIASAQKIRATMNNGVIEFEEESPDNWSVSEFDFNPETGESGIEPTASAVIRSWDVWNRCDDLRARGWTIEPQGWEQMVSNDEPDELVNGSKKAENWEEIPLDEWKDIMPDMGLSNEEIAQDFAEEMNAHPADDVGGRLKGFLRQNYPQQLNEFNAILGIYNQLAGNSKTADMSDDESVRIIRESFERGGPEFNATPGYDESIMKYTGCIPEEVGFVESLMRDERPTLDAINSEQFAQLARESYELYKYVMGKTGSRKTADEYGEFGQTEGTDPLGRYKARITPLADEFAASFGLTVTDVYVGSEGANIELSGKIPSGREDEAYGMANEMFSNQFVGVTLGPIYVGDDHDTLELHQTRASKAMAKSALRNPPEGDLEHTGAQRLRLQVFAVDDAEVTSQMSTLASRLESLGFEITTPFSVNELAYKEPIGVMEWIKSGSSMGVNPYSIPNYAPLSYALTVYLVNRGWELTSNAFDGVFSGELEGAWIEQIVDASSNEHTHYNVD